MKWGITFGGELQKMEKEMNLVWNTLFKEGPEGIENEGFQRVEKLPKSEGIGKASSRSRSSKHIRSV